MTGAAGRWEEDAAAGDPNSRSWVKREGQASGSLMDRAAVLRGVFGAGGDRSSALLLVPTRPVLRKGIRVGGRCAGAVLMPLPPRSPDSIQRVAPVKVKSHSATASRTPRRTQSGTVLVHRCGIGPAYSTFV